MSEERATTLTLLPATSLWWREVIRFLRQRSRIIGALGSPVVFWLLIGAGFGKSFVAPKDATGTTYAEFMYPGTLVLIVLFTAIFSTISIIDDRKEGFLQSVLVAPVSRMTIVLGKVMGGATLAFLQGCLFLCLAPLAGISLGGPVGLLLTLYLLAVVSIALTSVGFAIAWWMESTQGFHAIMNVILIPIWILSGALFPVSGAHAALKPVMLANPIFYCVEAFRWSFHSGGEGMPVDGRFLGLLGCLLAATVFAAVAFAVASATASRSRKGWV